MHGRARGYALSQAGKESSLTSSFRRPSGATEGTRWVVSVKINCLFDEMTSPKELKPHPKNRNKHPFDQIDRLANILLYQGFRYPIKVSKLSGYITSGHGRVLAAQKLGLKEVPVSYQDYSDEAQEYADVIADNAIAAWSELDLSGINSDLPDFGPELDIEMLGLKNFILEPLEKLNYQPESPDMPEFTAEDKTSYRRVVVNFLNDEDAGEFFRIIGQNDTGNTKSIWFQPQQEV